MTDLVNVTINITDIDNNKVECIIERLQYNCGDVDIQTVIHKPWPKLTTGDKVIYNGTEYMFLSYAANNRAKCILEESANNNVSYIKAIYFDCSFIQPNTKFIKMGE